MARLPAGPRWRELSPVLDQLLDLEPASRARRLEQVRASDAPLAEELRSMLESSGRARERGFLDGSAHDEAAPFADLLGARIGPYVIDAALGEGATGSVWRARQINASAPAVVAIKLLHPSLLGRTGAGRFRREGAILARLAHRNIARLLDSGVTPGGQPYLVLEHVDGVPIDQYCDAARLSVEQRLALLLDVMSGVEHAHDRGVIHRDIKPGNILVTRDGTAKLLDFGIAAWLEEGAASSGPPLTIDGHRPMTPRFAAPEQLTAGKTTAATDVYALGVLTYRLLTGRYPTAADTSSAADVMRSTLHDRPVRLSQALGRPHEGRAPDLDRIARDRGVGVARLAQQLQGGIERIVDVALRKDAGQRYQSVAALAGDVRRHLAGRSVSVRREPVLRRAASSLRPNWTVALGASLLALSLGVAGVEAWCAVHLARLGRLQAAAAATPVCRPVLTGAIVEPGRPSAGRSAQCAM